MAEYGQPGAVTRRVRFFDGQYLIDQDFVDEQKYHIDRGRRLGKVLRVTGIVEGLAVAAGGPNSLLVKAGTAIDAGGRLVVLDADRKVDLPAKIFNDKTSIKVMLLYREVATELATTGSRSERRWLEDPQILVVAPDGQATDKAWDDSIPQLLIAQLRVDAKGVPTVDNSVAQYAGVSVPGVLKVGGGTPTPTDWRLSVNGRVRLGGIDDYGGAAVLSVAPGTVAFDAPNVPGGRFVVDGTTGNVGISNPSPGGYRLNVSGRVRLGSDDYGADPVLSVAPGSVQFDAPNVPGGRLVIDGSNGRVGIGTGNVAPRTGLDTGKSVLSGAANDYIKAQFTMSGGGTVTWEGPGKRLKWTARFIVISAESGTTFANGYVDINQPTKPIPKDNCYDGVERAADATGVVLTNWDALYAEHPYGGKYTSVTETQFHIQRYTHKFHAPGNWILVAVVNGDDGSVKLGTGVHLSAASSSTRGNPLPVGTIIMWSGTADKIPAGWALCNGGPGTPDLRSRFIVGAGAGGTPEYAVGGKGDADQHRHKATFPGGVGSTTSAGDHNHAPPADWYDRSLAGGGGAILTYYNAIDRGAPSVKSVRTSTNGAHTHSVNLSGVGFDTDLSDPANQNRPKWYALCFIIKV